MNKKGLALYLDFANHHQDATPAAIKTLCQKVKQFHFHSAFVNPGYVTLAKEFLDKGLVGTVIAFPIGQETQDVKVLAALDAARKGADELDVSMNVGLFKAGKEKQVLTEMKAVVEGVKAIRPKVILKFIIETGFLTATEIKKASWLVFQSGAEFVKTNSGMGPRGASLKDVTLIREALGEKIKIKVAGGIDTLKEAENFIQAGADRIGTSKAPEIIKGLGGSNHPTKK
jgi:deoxyribose-phosphate aldolase